MPEVGSGLSHGGYQNWWFNGSSWVFFLPPLSLRAFFFLSFQSHSFLSTPHPLLLPLSIYTMRKNMMNPLTDSWGKFGKREKDDEALLCSLFFRKWLGGREEKNEEEEKIKIENQNKNKLKIKQPRLKKSYSK